MLADAGRPAAEARAAIVALDGWRRGVLGEHGNRGPDLAFALGHCFWRRTHARGAAGGFCGLVESEARLHDADVCVLARFGGRF